jgi:hypothetical protein
VEVAARLGFFLILFSGNPQRPRKELACNEIYKQVFFAITEDFLEYL